MFVCLLKTFEGLSSYLLLLILQQQSEETGQKQRPEETPLSFLKGAERLPKSTTPTLVLSVGLTVLRSILVCLDFHLQAHHSFSNNDPLS